MRIVFTIRLIYNRDIQKGGGFWANEKENSKYNTLSDRAYVPCILLVACSFMGDKSFGRLFVFCSSGMGGCCNLRNHFARFDLYCKAEI